MFCVYTQHNILLSLSVQQMQQAVKLSKLLYILQNVNAHNVEWQKGKWQCPKLFYFRFANILSPCL